MVSPEVPVPSRVTFTMRVMPSPAVPVSEAEASPMVGTVGVDVSTTTVSAVVGVPTLPARSTMRAEICCVPAVNGAVGVIVMLALITSADVTSTDPITVVPLRSSIRSLATAPPLARETVNRGWVRDVMLSLDELPVSSSAMRSGTPGAVWIVASMTSERAVDGGLETLVWDVAVAVSA